MGMTKQKLEVLQILKENLKNKGTAASIKTVYEKKNGKIGNVHELLSRCVAEGFISRTGDKEYAITTKGEAALKGIEEDLSKGIFFSDEELKQFEDFAKREDSLKVLSSMLNPGLLGLEKERLACLLSMISLNDSRGDKNRISVIYEGEPGSGKTSILQWAHKNLWGFYAEHDSTKSSLRGTGNGYQASGGLLNKADNSSLFVDEIDKMERDDQAGLLTAMEHGHVIINKDRVIDKKFDARVRVIASCNNKERLLPELIDRFDLRFYIKSITDEEKQFMLRTKIQNWGRDKGLYDVDFLKKYLEYAKQVSIVFPNDREKMAEIIIHELKTGMLQGRSTRDVESVIRLSLAIGRLRLHNEVTLEDLKEAMILKKM